MARYTLRVLAVLAFAAMPSIASASHLVGMEPPAALIVNRGGLEWVYAGPCSPVDPSCGVAVLHHGFVIPNDAQWLASFSDNLDLLAAFGGGAICASPYFNVAWDHCDGGDVAAGYVWGAPVPISGGPGFNDHPLAEAFLVRGAVPEPLAIALFGTGLVSWGIRRRKRA